MGTLEDWDIGATVMAGLGLGETEAQWEESEQYQQEGDGQTKTGGYMAMGMGSTHKGKILMFRDRKERKAALVPGCATAQVELAQPVGGPAQIRVRVDDADIDNRHAIACLVAALVTGLAMQKEWDKEGYDGKLE